LEVTLEPIFPPFLVIRASKFLRVMERVPLITKVNPLKTGPEDAFGFAVEFDEAALVEDDFADEVAADASASSRVCFVFVARRSSVLSLSSPFSAIEVSVRRWSLMLEGKIPRLRASVTKEELMRGVSLASAFWMVLVLLATSSAVAMRCVIYKEGINEVNIWTSMLPRRESEESRLGSSKTTNRSCLCTKWVKVRTV